MRRASLLLSLGLAACEAEVTNLRPPGPGPRQVELPSDCELAEVQVSAGLAGMSDFPADHTPGPISTSSRVLLNRRDPAGDLEIFALDPRNGSETRLTDDDVDAIVLDAEGESRLQLELGAEPRLWYREGTTEVDLGPAEYLRYSFDQRGAPTRQVGLARAVWIRGDEVVYWDGGAPKTLFEGRGPRQVTLGDAHVAWVATGISSGEIYIWGPNGAEQLTNDVADDANPIWSGRELFWLSDGALKRYSPEDDEMTTLDPGPCLAPAAHDGRAVFTCSPAPGLEYPPFMAELFIFDEGVVRAIPLLREGGKVFAPRNQGRRVAWIEYDPDFDSCGFGDAEVGSIVFIDLRTMDAPIEVARVGTTCWCCDAYWPEPTLSFEGDVLSWSFGLDPGRPEETRGSIGYALAQSPGCPH